MSWTRVASGQHWASSQIQDTSHRIRLTDGLDADADGEDEIEHESGMFGSSNQIDDGALK